MYDGHNICYTIFGGTIRHATINLSINDWLFKSAGGYSIKKICIKLILEMRKSIMSIYITAML